jgi:thiamine transport system substrate-binding protein
MRKRWLWCILLVLLAVSPILAQDSSVTLTVVTHDSFNVTENVLKQFETDNNITVQILRSGDAGEMVNKAVLSKDNPLGDVMYGVDNTFLSRALNADLFVPYESPLLKDVPDAFQIDLKHNVTPVDYGDVCLNYDIAYFDQQKLDLPQSLLDLTKPDYKSLLVVENPAKSSPGLAFLLATVAQFGETGDYTYLNYWADLVKNDVLVSDDWNDAYYNQFTMGGGNGTRPLVVSYASSPPFTVDSKTGMPTTGSIVADGTCFRQIEFVGIVNGTKNLDAAQKFVDFMLSQPFQEDMPLQMYVFPVNTTAKLPDEFTKFAAIPEKPVLMDYDQIDAHRDEWIKAWTETVLR